MIIVDRDWPYPCDTCGAHAVETHIHDADGRKHGPVLELASLTRCAACGPPCPICAAEAVPAVG